MSRTETNIESAKVDQKLILEALQNTDIANKLNFDPSLATNGGFEELEQELGQELQILTLEDCRSIYLADPNKPKGFNLSASRKGLVHDYFWEFATTVDKIAQKIVESGATDTKELKAHMFPKAEAETKPENAVVLSVVEVVSQLIRDCVEDGTIRLDRVRDQVHGHEGLTHFPGLRLAEIVQQVVGEKIEVIIDNHTKALNAIKAYINDETEIPEEILNFMISKVPGGRSVGNYTTDKIAHLYLTTQTDQTQNRREIRTLSDRDHLQVGKSPDALQAKTNAEHLADVQQVINNKKAVRETKIASRDFSESFRNSLSKNQAKLKTFEERLRAFLRNQGQENLLDGFEFEARTTVDRLSEREIHQGVAAMENLLKAIDTSGDLQLGPSDLSGIPALNFLLGNTARVIGSNFETRVRNFLTHTGQLGLLADITILNNEQDKIRATNKMHTERLAEFIEEDRIKKVSDIPEAIIRHLERHYQHKARTTKERAKLFLTDQDRTDLAEKLDSQLK